MIFQNFHIFLQRIFTVFRQYFDRVVLSINCYCFLSRLNRAVGPNPPLFEIYQSVAENKFDHHFYCVVPMDNYFPDPIDQQFSKNKPLQANSSNSTLDTNPISELRKLEQSILNMFNLAKTEISAIYQLVCAEVNRLIRASRYGKNHNNEFLDEIIEIRSLTQEIMIDLPRQIRKILIGPQIFHTHATGRAQFNFSRSSSKSKPKSKLSRSLEKRKLSGIKSRKPSSDNQDSFIYSSPSESSVRARRMQKASKYQQKKKKYQQPNIKQKGQWEDAQEIDMCSKNLTFFEPLNKVTAVNLKTMNFSQNKFFNLQFLKGAYFTRLTRLNISGNKLKNISGLQETNFPALQHLNLSNNSLLVIDGLEQCSFPQLLELNLARNKLKSISILKQCNFPKLQILNIDQNELISLQPLIECSFSFLKVLTFSSNHIMSLKFVQQVKFKHLQALIGHNNSIKHLDPLTDAKFPNITTIILNDNKIAEIDCLLKTYFPRLTELDLENNHVKRKQLGCFLLMQKGLREVRRKYPFLQL